MNNAVLYMLPLFFLQLFTLCAGAWLWYVPLKKGTGGNSGKSPLSFASVLRINLAGTFIESITPSVKLGGEAAKFFLFRKASGAGYRELASVMVYHKFIVFIPFAAACSIFLIPGLISIEMPSRFYNSFAAFSAAGAAVFAVYAFSAKKFKNIPGTWQTAGLLLLSLAIWLLYPVKIYTAARAVGAEPGLLLSSLATYSSYLMGMIPLLPGGLGAFEGTMVLVFTLAGFTAVQGAAIALASRAVTFWFTMAVSGAAALTVLKDGNIRKQIMEYRKNRKGKEKREKNPAVKTVKHIRSLEYLGVKSGLFRKIYGSLFYSRLVRKEAEECGINPGSRVLHVGCGPMPYTAIMLAETGIKVTGVDIDPGAVLSARKMVKQAGADRLVDIQHGDGKNLDPRDYDFIWVSLHAEPKEEVVPALLERMREGAVLVFRNPRGWLKLWYKDYYPSGYSYKTRQFFGKESVRVVKTRDKAVIPLEALAPGQTGIIVSVPEHPLLSPLGFRPGKQITLKVRGMFNGPLVADIEGRCSAVNRSLAGMVQVMPWCRKAA